MYQMTLYELDMDKIRPEKEKSLSGSIFYKCGICGAPVGIYDPKNFHEPGWIYKREACQNGHTVEWGEL